MFAALKSKLHDALAELEKLEVEMQKLTSIGADKTGPGADVLNSGEAAHDGGADPVPPDAPADPAPADPAPTPDPNAPGVPPAA